MVGLFRHPTKNLGVKYNKLAVLSIVDRRTLWAKGQRKRAAVVLLA